MAPTAPAEFQEFQEMSTSSTEVSPKHTREPPSLTTPDLASVSTQSSVRSNESAVVEGTDECNSDAASEGELSDTDPGETSTRCSRRCRQRRQARRRRALARAAEAAATAAAAAQTGALNNTVSPKAAQRSVVTLADLGFDIGAPPPPTHSKPAIAPVAATVEAIPVAQAPAMQLPFDGSGALDPESPIWTPSTAAQPWAATDGWAHVDWNVVTLQGATSKMYAVPVAASTHAWGNMPVGDSCYWAAGVADQALADPYTEQSIVDPFWLMSGMSMSPNDLAEQLRAVAPDKYED